MNVFLYIDATTGGMALQVILSGLVGGLVIIKLFWRNLVNTILRRRPEEDDDAEQAAAHEATSTTTTSAEVDSSAS